MIDIHTHVLPGVDDGVKDFDEAVNLIEILSEQGYKGLFVTPHYAPLRGFEKPFHIVKETFDRLVELVQLRDIPMKLYLGAEVDEYDHLDTLMKKTTTMHGSRFVLMDFGTRRADISETVYEMRLKGHTVIVAHPERYYFTTFEDLKKIKKEGALLQVSAPHLVGLGAKQSQKMAKKLLKHDMIDFIASDIHRLGNNVKAMQKAYNKVKRKKGIAYAEQLFNENPKILISAGHGA